MAGGEFRLGTVATYMSTYISILTISHNPYRKHIHVNHPASTNLGFGVLPPNLDLRYVELRPRLQIGLTRTAGSHIVARRSLEGLAPVDATPLSYACVLGHGRPGRLQEACRRGGCTPTRAITGKPGVNRCRRKHT